jgi:hypothetical protein
VQHKIVIFTICFRPYTAIIRCHAKLFTTLLVSIFKMKMKIVITIKIKIDRPVRCSKNGFDLLVGYISVIFSSTGVFHVVKFVEDKVTTE